MELEDIAKIKSKFICCVVETVSKGQQLYIKLM